MASSKAQSAIRKEKTMELTTINYILLALYSVAIGFFNGYIYSACKAGEVDASAKRVLNATFSVSTLLLLFGLTDLQHLGNANFFHVCLLVVAVAVLSFIGMVLSGVYRGFIGEFKKARLLSARKDAALDALGVKIK
jgi:hypothetical protein